MAVGHGVRPMTCGGIRVVRVVAYTRVSTLDQAASGAGLGAQRTAISEEAGRRGWTIVSTIEDAGVSGRTLQRPGLERALDLCRAGQADGIVVAKLDRLSRSVVGFGRLLEAAKREGWNVVALDFGIDLSTPGGELVANVLVSVAQWEARVIGDRTREGLAEKRAQGVKLGRRFSVPEDIRAQIVDARAAGRTLRSIADELNRHAVPTARGGREWAPETVRKVWMTAASGGGQAVVVNAGRSVRPQGRARREARDQGDRHVDRSPR